MEFLSIVLAQVTVGKLLTYGFLLLIIVFMWYLLKTSSDKANKFHWIDIISNPDGSASLTRVLQFSAGVTATWVIIKLTVNNNLGIEFFGTYLAAMGISEGFTKWIQYRTKESKSE